MDSAEKWKQFAEQLQAKQGELQEALAGAQAELQVGNLGRRCMVHTTSPPTTSAHSPQQGQPSPPANHSPPPFATLYCQCRRCSRAWRWRRRRAMTWTFAPRRWGGVAVEAVAAYCSEAPTAAPAGLLAVLHCHCSTGLPTAAAQHQCIQTLPPLCPCRPRRSARSWPRSWRQSGSGCRARPSRWVGCGGGVDRLAG